MRLTVLGNAGNYLAPLSGGSSYLVEGGGARVLLDAGGGSREALARHPGPLDAVVLSHFHHDHVLDLPTLPLGEGTRVFVPPGERARLEALARAYVFEGGWDLPGLAEAAWGRMIRVGGLRLSFAPTQHSAPSMATRIEEDSAALVYASDTAPCAGLEELARECDLLLMHTLLPVVEAGAAHGRVHSTAETAAALAVHAGARSLLLSHRFHGAGDEAMRRHARRHPAVTLAEDGATYLTGPES